MGFFQTVAAFSTNSVMLLLTRLGLRAAEAPILPAGGKLNAIWMTPNERARAPRCSTAARRWVRHSAQS
jgi:ACS family D-galactonate transporter-like MFS transporter